MSSLRKRDRGALKVRVRRETFLIRLVLRVRRVILRVGAADFGVVAFRLCSLYFRIRVRAVAKLVHNLKWGFLIFRGK